MGNAQRRSPFGRHELARSCSPRSLLEDLSSPSLKKALLAVLDAVFYLKKTTSSKYIFVGALDGSEKLRNEGIGV